MIAPLSSIFQFQFLYKLIVLLSFHIVLINLLLYNYCANVELLYRVIHLLSFLLINIVIDSNPSVKPEDGTF